MKLKKIISAIGAVAITTAAFAGLSVQAASVDAWETVYENDFTSGNGATIAASEAGTTNTRTIENGELKLGGTNWDTYHISLGSSYSTSDKNIIKLTCDVNASGRLSIGLGDTVRMNGAYWLFYINSNGLGAGHANELYKSLYTGYNSTTEATAELNKWYCVEAYVDLYNKKVLTKAWKKDVPGTIYVRYDDFAPATSDGNKYLTGFSGSEINSVKLFSTATSNSIDNLKVERLSSYSSDGIADGLLYHADFDVSGGVPEKPYNAGTPAISVDGLNNKYLSLNGTWERYRQALGKSRVSTTSAGIIKMSFDVSFADNNSNGVGLGTATDDEGSYWVISYNGKGLVIGSNENNEGSKIAYLTDSSGNKPTVTSNTWYRVESSIEFPSKTISTTFYERDASDPTKYTASMTAPAFVNRQVGGLKDGLDVSYLRYMSVSGMNIDNMDIERIDIPFAVNSVTSSEGTVTVSFNSKISDASGITIGGKSATGTLSADGQKYIVDTASLGLSTGTYQLTVPAGLTTADNKKSLASAYTASVSVYDSDTLGYHPFDNGKDNGSNLGLAGQGSDWGSLEYDEDNDNYYLHATKGSGGVGAWNPWSWLPSGSTSKDIDSYWNSSAVSKYISVEFDIRSCGVPTNLERVYFSHAHNHQNGLEILGMNASVVAMGEPEASRAFSGITNLTVGKWYHYKYILDTVNKRAMAVLSDGTDTYTKDWMSVAGDGEGYWKTALQTPFDTIAFQLPGGNIDIDNVAFKKYTASDYDITLSQVEGGTVAAAASAAEGSEVTVTATPAANYELSYITVDGRQISGNTFIMPAKAVTVSAVFTSTAPAEITMTAVASSEEYTYGSTKVHNIGFKTDQIDDLSKYTKLVISGWDADKTLYYPLSELGLDGISGPVLLGIQINHVPADKNLSMTIQ